MCDDQMFVCLFCPSYFSNIFFNKPRKVANSGWGGKRTQDNHFWTKQKKKHKPFICKKSMMRKFKMDLKLKHVFNTSLQHKYLFPENVECNCHSIDS